MDTPQPEYLRLRGTEPGDTNPVSWSGKFSGRFIVFETNRRVIEEKDINLVRWICSWRRQLGLSSTSGCIHSLEFPDCQSVEAKVWTVHRAFHHIRPSDISPAPSRVLCFVTIDDLRRWKRQCLPKKETAYAVHFRCCYDPSGTLIPNYIVLTVGG